MIYVLRSSDMAEGIQCVVRMSDVADFAVFVWRTTTCINQTRVNKCHTSLKKPRPTESSYLLIFQIKLQKLILALLYHAGQALQIFYRLTVKRKNLQHNWEATDRKMVSMEVCLTAQ